MKGDSREWKKPGEGHIAWNKCAREKQKIGENDWV